MQYTDVCEQLKHEAAVLGNVIETSKENLKKRGMYERDKEVFVPMLEEYKLISKRLSQLTSDICEYLGEKKKRGNQSINAALLSARNVIPDSMSGIRLTISGDEAWLESEEGMLMERMEGGGFRATCSLFMRKIALSSAPETMQFMILDELLAKLSQESSATLSQYLPILARDSQIIVIEQKSEVYSQLNCQRYHFFLAEGQTIVKKEEIKNGETDGGAGD